MEEIAGILGGILFFVSWIYQAWETHKAGKAVVSSKFFLIRLTASILLMYEAIRVKSVGLMLAIAGTIFLILYNIYVIKRKKEQDSAN